MGAPAHKLEPISLLQGFHRAHKAAPSRRLFQPAHIYAHMVLPRGICHIPAALQISLGEAAPVIDLLHGKDGSLRVEFSAFFQGVHGPAIGVYRDGDVFPPLHASLDFQGAYPHPAQLAQQADRAQVRRT